MKKILIIIFAFTFFTSCIKDANDARKVKVGISTNELKYVMGEPDNIEVQNGSECWIFFYKSKGFFSNYNRMEITVINDKIVNFKTW